MKITVSVKTDKIGSECKREIEIERGDYLDENGNIDHAALEDIAKEWLFDMIEWDYEIVEGD